MNRQRVALIAFLVLVLATPARAHRIRVFGSHHGDKVVCRGFFGSGRPAMDCKVRALRADGSVAAEGRTDAKGRFEFPSRAQEELTIVLDAGAGHRATYTLKPEGAGSTPAPAAPSPKAPATHASLAEGDDALRRVVQEVLREEMAELRDELRIAADRSPGMTEIVGGIGYIIGLMGLAFYMHSRQRPPHSRDKP